MADSEPGHEVARSELRASHQDRDRVVELLRVSAGDGRLTAEELDERLELALTARTYGELAGLVADLPAGSAVSAPAPRAKEVVRIDTRSGHTKREGRWVVPQRIEARIRSGHLKLAADRCLGPGRQRSSRRPPGAPDLLAVADQAAEAIRDRDTLSR